MRYREGQEVDPNNPYTENTHKALEFSLWLSIPIGLVLLWMGIKGKILWLKVWSVGLIGLSIYYLIVEGIR